MFWFIILPPECSDCIRRSDYEKTACPSGRRLQCPLEILFSEISLAAHRPKTLVSNQGTLRLHRRLPDLLSEVVPDVGRGYQIRSPSAKSIWSIFSFQTRIAVTEGLLADFARLAYQKVMDISRDSLEKALSIRRQIETLESRLAALLGRAISSRPTTGKGRRHMSAAARAKIAAAARARWARFRAGKGKGAKKSGRRRGGITAAGRRRLSQLMKARWAARRKAQKK